VFKEKKNYHRLKALFNMNMNPVRYVAKNIIATPNPTSHSEVSGGVNNFIP